MVQQTEIQDIYPLSYMQEGMLFHSLFDQESRAYFEQASFTIYGPLDTERFQKSIDAIFERYEIFRTAFIHKNVAKPRQVVLKNRQSRIQFVDISHLDEAAQEGYVDQFRKDDKKKGFDLQTDPLMRVAILKRGQERFDCIWSHHHILMDGWCFGLVMKDFLVIYKALGDGQPPYLEPVQPYSKYMKWLMRQDREEAEAFWKTKLLDLEQTASLPKKSDVSRGELQQLAFTISEEQTEGLRNIAASAGATLNTVFQALWGILLQRLNRCDDTVFGSVVSGRPSDLEGVEKMVGLFINTVPVRVNSGHFSFSELVSHLQEESLKAEAYSHYPLYDIQTLSALKQDLFDHIIVFENVPAQREIEGLNQAGAFDFSVEDFTMDEVTNYGCSIKVIPGNSLYIRLNFDIGVYEPAMMEHIETYLRHMIDSVIADPDMQASQVSLIGGENAREMLNKFNQTKTAEPWAPTLHALFARRAALSPHLPALRFSGGIMTYGELDQYTNRLAMRLKEKGAEEGSVIGVLAERSPEMVISVLAVLKAGGAYVPLDPAYPEERLGFMLHDSGAKLLIVQTGLSVPGFSGETMEVDLAALTEETSETEPLSVDIDGGSLAYIIYTSGSTGRPKGVAVEHRQAVAFLSGMQEQFPLSEDDVIVLKSSFSFDASIWQLFWWAIPGASVYLLPPGWEKDPALMAETFTAEGVTTAHFIPAMVNSFLERLEMETEEKRTSLSNTLKRVFAGGEALAPQTAARFARLLPETALIHGYGPTEATVDAAFHVYDARKDSERTRLPIGKPVPGARLYVLDDQRAVQPVGVAGELYIAGSGVSRGYVNRPELTEERFLDDPFYPGERMYRTGDLARWLPDGHVEWLGRLDSQVKIRGYRIEPGEIEAAIRHIEGVREAAVAARTENGETGLVAYIEGQNQQTVRTELAKRLPAYMMPSHVIEMKQWPVTPSGKLDRKALPAPDGAADRGAYAPPRNMTEMKLARLWEEVLKNGPVGIRDHFFERGGHSLKATALVSRIVKEFGVQVPLKDIFARPTVEELAAVIQELDETPYAAIEPAEKQDTYPVSSAQKRMYVLQQLDEGGTGYNMPAVLELTGPLDRARLDTVFRQLIRRHESLRTSFETGADGEPVQRIHDEVPFRLMEEASAEHFVRPFRLHEAPLFRAALVKEAEERHLLLVDMHHIISDGVSVNTLIREFCELYASRTLDPMRIQYKDYAVWQQEFKKGEAYRRQEAYWLKQLDGELPVLELPADNARPAVRSFAGDTVSRTVDAKTAAGLYRIARENGCTLYMVLLAAFNTLLARLGGQEDIIVGSPIAGRPHKDLEPILGMFVNTLAIRTHPTENKRFSDFLREVRQTALEAYEHQDYPFEELVERLGVVRDMSRNPLFDAMFILQNMEQHDIRLAGLHVNRVQEIGHKVSIFDLTLSAVEESGGEIHFEMEFSTDLFLKETVERWLKHFAELLRDIAIQPETKLSRLNMLTDDDKHKILVEFNDTQINFPEKNKLFHELFEKKAEDVPGQIAVIKGQKQISYRQLNERANQLARTLQKAGISPGKKAAVLADRSIEAVICVLAVMKAGGAYIPIDSQYPEERIRFLLKDSEAAVLLQADYKELASHLAESGVSCISIHLDHEEHDDPDTENLVSTASPEDTAYVIYTSGTTGTPKGVEVRHRNFTHAALAWRNIYELDRMPARVLQMASFSFDVFSGDLARALLNGGTLVICPDDVRLEPEQLSQLINQQQITFMESTPALIVPFMEYVYRRRRSLPSLRLLILGSDVIKAQDFYTLNKRFGKELRIMNSYGVTEATIDSSYYEVQMSQELREEFVPIGIPLPNVQLYVLNNDKQVQPIGIPGELYIGGEGVAKGYWGRAELSEAKFNDPFAKGQTLYQTGDQACWLPDGTLRFCGRMDKQVKIKGYRIETGEIESVILQNSHIKEAAVAVQKDADGQSYLAAYIVPKETDFTDLRLALTKELPAYMIPAHFFGLEKMPLTVNGKLDKDALPAVHIKPSPVYHPPNSDKQAVLCRIWEDVLHIPRAGITDSFFELGGDSIKALQVSARLAAEGWNMTIRDLFQFPTIQELEHHLTPAETIPDQGAVEGHAELTPVQQRFFDDPGAFEHHYNQSVMMCSKERLDERALCQAIRSLTEHHDALRIVFTKESSGRIRQFNRGIGTKDEDIFTLRTIDLTDVTQIEQRIKAEEKAIQQAMRLDQGPLIHVGLFRLREADHLLISIHHLIVDGVSWRILLEDLQTAYQQAIENRKIELPLKSDSYLKYANKLPAIAKGHEVMEEKAYWEHVMSQTEPLPKDFRGVSDGLQINARTATCTLSERLTSRLLFETQQAYGTDANELMLTALGMALTEWTKSEQTVISIEGHGREGHVPDLDISRTVGWFTSIYPVLLNMSVPDDSSEKTAYRIKAVKDMMRRVPNRGTGYGLLKYSNHIRYRDPEVSFNYLGQFDGLEGMMRLSPYQPLHEIAEERPREFELDINAMIVNRQLQVKAVYTDVFSRRTIESFLDTFHDCLKGIIEHCAARKEREKTLSDFTNKELTSASLTSIANLVKEL
ncbi:non-ribosomal peptide synthetase [Bacillus glycinifermentans]|uniref:non-ribosomal peptide synthetase n=1 Tax=Bacillus glycinifermentans TaxID=1664069 RepID=UPI001FF65E07|nr:non-ribosomal peptide synthetase [Bacillus glycinifermentans]UOY90729.1 amino acid adenylation domain-containing protein [Bacillus glycinifermentans]